MFENIGLLTEPQKSSRDQDKEKSSLQKDVLYSHKNNIADRHLIVPDAKTYPRFVLAPYVLKLRNHGGTRETRAEALSS